MVGVGIVPMTAPTTILMMLMTFVVIVIVVIMMILIGVARPASLPSVVAATTPTTHIVASTETMTCVTAHRRCSYHFRK